MLTYCVAIGALLFLINLSLIFFLVVRQKHYGINDHLYFGVERQQGLDPLPRARLTSPSNQPYNRGLTMTAPMVRVKS